MGPFSVPFLCRKYQEIAFSRNIYALMDTFYALLHLPKLAYRSNNPEKSSRTNLNYVYSNRREETILFGDRLARLLNYSFCIIVRLEKEIE